MAQTGVMILVAGALLVLYLALFRTVDTALTGKPPRYPEALIAEGAHCVDQLLGWENPLAADLRRRIDTATSVSVDGVTPGPLRPDGTRNLTVQYRILRQDQRLSDVMKATGTLNNADCTYDLTMVQR